MTGFENESDDTTDKPDVKFNVEDAVNPAVGEPVFAEDGDELCVASSEDIATIDETLNEDADEQDDLTADAEESSDETLQADSDETADEGALTERDDEEGSATTTVLAEELTLFGKIESIIFASPKPMRAVEIHDLLAEQGYTLKEVQDACDELIEFYRDRAGGFHLKYIKRMGYQFQTTPAAKSLMERQFASRPRPLSRAALETLAVIAYRQKQSKGVTRAEVEFIRGVDAGSIFKTLVERNMLNCIGRKEIPGRPMMFGVTDEFLKIFQLGSINDLPPLESFQTPQDVLDAASQKITDFEAEQAGVDTEQFIADEEYSEAVRGESDFNPLAAEAPVYAPTLESVPDEEAESKADLIDVLNEGQVAWTASGGHTEDRLIHGATAGGVISSIDAIDESEWGEVKPVEMTVNAAEQSLYEISGRESGGALLNERDETSEVAFPTGYSQPSRGGEVDQ